MKIKLDEGVVEGNSMLIKCIEMAHKRLLQRFPQY